MPPECLSLQIFIVRDSFRLSQRSITARRMSLLNEMPLDSAEDGSPLAARTGNDDLLLTPGPLTTSLGVKRAMLKDWGSRDPAFIELDADILGRLVALAGGTGEFVCVPVQGSGAFAIEATLGTLVPRDGKLLVLVNGAYGERMLEIMRYLGRPAVALKVAEGEIHV